MSQFNWGVLLCAAMMLAALGCQTPATYAPYGGTYPPAYPTATNNCGCPPGYAPVYPGTGSYPVAPPATTYPPGAPTWQASPPVQPPTTSGTVVPPPSGGATAVGGI